MIPSQLLKGTLEGCILGVIGQKETYGYEIAQKLEGYRFGRIAEGTIYPLLLRLEKGGRIQAVYRPSAAGPKRKYYSLTAQGQADWEIFQRQYRELTQAVAHLLRDAAPGEASQ